MRVKTTHFSARLLAKPQPSTALPHHLPALGGRALLAHTPRCHIDLTVDVPLFTGKPAMKGGMDSFFSLTKPICIQTLYASLRCYLSGNLTSPRQDQFGFMISFAVKPLYEIEKTLNFKRLIEYFAKACNCLPHQDL